MEVGNKLRYKMKFEWIYKFQYLLNLILDVRTFFYE